MGEWIDKRHSDVIPPTLATHKIRHLAPKNTALTITTNSPAVKGPRVKNGVSILTPTGANLTPYFHALTITIYEHGKLLAPPFQKNNWLPWLAGLVTDVGVQCYGTPHPWHLTLDKKIPGVTT